MRNFNFRAAATVVFCLYIFAHTAAAQPFARFFDPEKMRERVKKLSADEMQGRGPGNAGGKLAAEYIAEQLKLVGAIPGNGKSYFQNVRLVGVKADPATRLLASANGRNEEFIFGDEFVATTGEQKAHTSLDSELVFVGYGIDAPQYRWNDYTGNSDDYRGKVLLIMVNDPPATDSEPDLFGGKALTYYGRWTYKYEEAARRGAAGVILIHTNESAGYGWNVVRTSNGNWRYEIARLPMDKTPFLKIKAWMTFDGVHRLLGMAGLSADELTAAAKKRGFKPVRTGIRVKLDLKSDLVNLESPNVVAMIPGKDKLLRGEYVVYSAHWDHLGIGEPDAGGDRIYNGAYDNASGVAAVIGIAEALQKMPVSMRPKRSSYFLFPTAEEQGLLGAEYFAANPLIPPAKIAANVNIDGVNFFGITRDFSALGAERSSLDKLIQSVADERNLRLEGDMYPEQGFFFRSDHFPFAKIGVPAVSLRHGDDFVQPLEGTALEFFRQYTAKFYHQPSDEYHDWWKMDAMIQNAEIGLAIGVKAGNAKRFPRYKTTDEFYRADRQRMGGR